MIARDHEHEAVAAERIGFEPAGIDGAGDDAEIGDAFGDQADDLVAQPLFQIDADIRMRGKERRQRLGQKLGQRVGVRQHPDLAGQPAAIGAEVLVQSLGLAQDGARMLQQRAAGLRRRHALAAARQQRHAEHVLHVADAGRGCGERKMRALGAVRDAAGLDDVAKQAEIGEIEAHGKNAAFAFCEVRLNDIAHCYLSISTLFFRVRRNRDHATVSSFMRCCIAARPRIG